MVADLPRTRKNGAVTERLASLEAKRTKINTFFTNLKIQTLLIILS